MARRHVMRLFIGGDSYRVELEPEWPAGYVVKVTAEPTGGRPKVISETVYESHLTASEAFLATCRNVLTAYATAIDPVQLSPASVVPIEETV